MRWRAAFMGMTVVVSGGCLNINCDPPDPCPGYAVYPNDFYVASECACPARSDIWRCDDERDFAVSVPPDLSPADFAVVDGSGGD